VKDTRRVTLIAQTLREQLFDWAKSKKRTALLKVFRAMDKSGTGCVNRADMESCLKKKMRLDVSDRDLDVLMDCIDFDGNGKIGYDEFLDFAFHQPEGEEIGVIHEIIARETRNEDLNLASEFSRYDPRRRGLVKDSDFEKILQRLGMELKERDVQELLKRFSFNGEVEYEEFCRWATSGANVQRTERKVRRSLQKLMAIGYDAKEIFRAVDSDHSGDVSVAEFQAALQDLGLMITEGEIRGLVKKYSTRGGRGIRYEEFLELANEDLADLGAVCLLPEALREVLVEGLRAAGADGLRLDFQRQDKKGSGTVGAKTFDKILAGKVKGARLTRDDIDLVRSCFQLEDGGPVHYLPFVFQAYHFEETRDLADLHRQLAAAYEAGELDPGKLFKRYDPDGVGTVNAKSFGKGFDRARGVDLHRQDLALLVESFGTARNGDVDYLYFEAWARAGTQQGRRELERRFRWCLQVMHTSGDDYRRVFRALDTHGNGTISLRDLNRAVSALGLPFGDHEVRVLGEAFMSRQDRNAVDYSALADDVTGGAGEDEGPGGGSDQAISATHRRRLGVWFREKARALRGKVFAREDPDGKGTVGKKKFLTCLEKAGCPLPKGVLSTLAEAFSTTGSDKCHYADFLAFCSLNLPLDLDEAALAKAHFQLLRQATENPELVRASPADVLAAFRRDDRDGAQVVPSRAFRRVLEDTFRVDLAPTESRTLCQAFESGESGDVDYVTFTASLCLGKHLQRLKRRLKRSTQLLLESGEAVDLIRELSRCEDRRGEIDPDDFRKVLESTGLALSDAEIRVVVFHLTRSGHELTVAKFKEFLKTSRASGEDDVAAGQLFGGAEKEVEDVIRRLRSALRDWEARHPGKLPDLFLKADEDRSGWISPREFRKLLAKFDLELSSHDQRVLLSCFDLDGDGSISREEFLDFVWKPPSSEEIGVIGQKLRDYAEEKGINLASLRDQFHKLDRKTYGEVTGFVPRIGMRRILQKLMPELLLPELEEIERSFKKHEPDGSDSESSETSADRERSTRNRGGAGWLGLATRSPNVKGQICWVRFMTWLEAGRSDKALVKIRRKLKELPSAERQTTVTAFLDSAPSKISKHDLSRLLGELQLTLTMTQFNAVWRELDEDDAEYITESVVQEMFGMSRAEKKALTRAKSRGNGSKDPTDIEELGAEELVLRLRDALEVSFDAIWQHYDKDRSGALDDEELDRLCETMLRAAHPDLEPTVQQVAEVKDRVTLKNHQREGSASRKKSSRRRGQSERFVDYDTLKYGLLEYLEEQYREQLASGELRSEGTYVDIVDHFCQFDRNGDGHISSREFMFFLVHKMKILKKHECQALVHVLDRDQDGEISFNEFQELFTEAYATHENLSPLVKSAVIKLKLGYLPNPADFLAFTFLQHRWDGVPGSARVSSLSKLDTVHRHKLRHVMVAREAVSAAGSTSAQTSGGATGASDLNVIQSILTLVRAEGIPTTASQAHSALVAPSSRAARVSLFYSGHTEHFQHESVLANLHKSLAKINSNVRPDKWTFPDDQMDASEESSVLIRCEPGRLKEERQLVAEPKLSDFWVLVELAMTIRKPNRRQRRGGGASGQRGEDGPPRHWSSNTRRFGATKGSDRDGSSDESDGGRRRHPSGSRKSKTGRRKKRRSRGAHSEGESGSDSDGTENLESSASDQDTSDRKRSTRRKKPHLKGHAAEATEHDSDEDEEDIELPGVEVVNVSCGWVKIPLQELCTGSRRTVTYPVMHGNPWGTEQGEPIPVSDYREHQNGIFHQLGDAMPSTIGRFFRRQCSLTVNIQPLSGRKNFMLVDELQLLGLNKLTSTHMSEILSNLPRTSIVPLGGKGCATLALLATFWHARRRAAALCPTEDSPLPTRTLAILPEILGDSAIFAALGSAFAGRYYQSLLKNSSFLVGKGGSSLLECLMPLVEELVNDFWIIAGCEEMLVAREAGVYEREYIGGYSNLREAVPESWEQFRLRVIRILDEYKSEIRIRVRRRHLSGDFASYPEECILGSNDELIRAKKRRIIDPAVEVKGKETIQLVTPFNTRELADIRGQGSSTDMFGDAMALSHSLGSGGFSEDAD